MHAHVREGIHAHMNSNGASVYRIVGEIFFACRYVVYVHHVYGGVYVGVHIYFMHVYYVEYMAFAFQL